MRARSASEVGNNRSGRCNDVREFVGGPLDELRVGRLVASPFLRCALTVVNETKEPVRRGHGDDVSGAVDDVSEIDGVVPTRSVHQEHR